MTDETKPPVKRRGRKRSATPTLGTVRQMFPEDPDAPKQTSRILVPEPGAPYSKGDKRRQGRFKAGQGPGAVHFRTGKRWAEIIHAVDDGEYTWEEFVEGLDAQELARGQLRDKQGGFRGRPPSMVPRAFFNACTNEILKRGNVMWKEGYPEAIRLMLDLAKDEKVKAETRLKAAQFVVERIEGKAVQAVQLTVEDPWQTLLSGVVAEVEEDKAIARAHDYTAREEAMKGDDDDSE